MIMILVDKLGRKLTLQVAAICIFFSLVSALLFDSWYLKMLFLGLANGCEGCFSNLFNILLNETACKPQNITLIFNLRNSKGDKIEVENGALLFDELLSRLYRVKSG